jgi:hypothetical protein
MAIVLTIDLNPIYILESNVLAGEKCKKCEDKIYGECKSLSLMLKINDNLSVDHLANFCNSCSQAIEEIVNEFNNH